MNRIDDSVGKRGVAAPARGLLLGALAAGIGLVGCASTVPGSTAPPPLPAGVVVDRVERPYVIRGTTRAAIARSLGENRITTPKGRFTGVHEWSVRWSFRYGPAGSTCAMKTVEVRLRSETVLPRWEDRSVADSALVRDWDTFIGRLRTHENEHRSFAYGAARDIQRALKRMRVQSCGFMTARANQRAREILERYTERSQSYDEETRHGATEGIRWPPEPPGSPEVDSGPGPR